MLLTSSLGAWQEYVAAAAPLLFQGGEVEGTPAWQRLKLMAQYYWQVWARRDTAPVCSEAGFSCRDISRMLCEGLKVFARSNMTCAMPDS